MKGILAISSRDLANCILSQDWKMRKAGLLIIAKQAKYLYDPNKVDELDKIDIKFEGMDKKQFLR